MFEVNFERLTDLLNPRKSHNVFEEVSEFTMPGWGYPTHLHEPTGERGRIESFAFRSEISRSERGITFAIEREIKVYLPPGYDDGGERYPLLIVNNGLRALEFGKMDHSLDNLIGRTVAPLIVALVPPVDLWRECGGRFTDEYGGSTAARPRIKRRV